MEDKKPHKPLKIVTRQLDELKDKKFTNIYNQEIPKGPHWVYLHSTGKWEKIDIKPKH